MPAALCRATVPVTRIASAMLGFTVMELHAALVQKLFFLWTNRDRLLIGLSYRIPTKLYFLAVTKAPILNATVHFGNDTHDNENLTTTSARPTPASTSITFVTTKTANRTTAAIEARTTTTTQINLFDSEEQTETTVVHTTERRTTPTTTIETGVNLNVVSAEQNAAKKVQPNHDKKSEFLT